jgi:parvulin-like peptidyl-prolyl isomerase
VPGSSATVTIGTPGAGGTPTATPTVNLDAYARALAQRLERSQLTKAELEAVTAAGLYEDRLTEKFKADLPRTAPQVLLVTARIPDQATAERVRSIGLRPGVDFGPVAAQNSVSDAKGARAGTSAWVIVDQLEPTVRDVVKNMKAGDISTVTQNGTYYEVYKVVEVNAARELDDSLKNQLALQKVLDWLTTEGKNLKLERDLTTAKEQWITDHVVSAYQKASATPRAR